MATTIPAVTSVWDGVKWVDTATKVSTYLFTTVEINAILAQTLKSGVAIDYATVPVAGATTGDMYIVKPGAASGPFANVANANQVALFTSTGWEFFAPQTDDTHFVKTAGTTLQWDGVEWVKLNNDGHRHYIQDAQPTGATYQTGDTWDTITAPVVFHKYNGTTWDVLTATVKAIAPSVSILREVTTPSPSVDLPFANKPLKYIKAYGWVECAVGGDSYFNLKQSGHLVNANTNIQNLFMHYVHDGISAREPNIIFHDKLRINVTSGGLIVKPGTPMQFEISGTKAINKWLFTVKTNYIAETGIAPISNIMSFELPATVADTMDGVEFEFQSDAGGTHAINGTGLFVVEAQ